MLKFTYHKGDLFQADPSLIVVTEDCLQTTKRTGFLNILAKKYPKYVSDINNQKYLFTNYHGATQRSRGNRAYNISLNHAGVGWHFDKLKTPIAALYARVTSESRYGMSKALIKKRLKESYSPIYGELENAGFSFIHPQEMWLGMYNSPEVLDGILYAKRYVECTYCMINMTDESHLNQLTELERERGLEAFAASLIRLVNSDTFKHVRNNICMPLPSLFLSDLKYVEKMQSFSFKNDFVKSQIWAFKEEQLSYRKNDDIGYFKRVIAPALCDYYEQARKSFPQLPSVEINVYYLHDPNEK